VGVLRKVKDQIWAVMLGLSRRGWAMERQCKEKAVAKCI